MMQTHNQDTVIIYTDGACSGNPGPGGWGAILMYQGKEKALFGYQPQATNNQMELQAVIEGLGALKKPCKVAVYTDSTYVRDGMKSWIHGWKKNGWKTANKKPVKNAELWQQLDVACQKHKVEFIWVKAHADNEHNNRVDALARAAIANAQKSA